MADGVRAEADKRAACVDCYYRAAIRAWSELECAGSASAEVVDHQSAWRIYQESVARLVPAAVRFRRLDPRTGLVVHDVAGRRVVPTAYYGFAWQPGDFSQLLGADDYPSDKLRKYYHTEGLGVGLVVVRNAAVEETYFRKTQPFPATAVLRIVRPAEAAAQDAGRSVDSAGAQAVLEFYNPRALDRVAVGSCAAAGLERNLSAPLEFLAKQSSRIYIEGFLAPAETQVKPKLGMVEPYQRGKTPVVFIHGLLSDPSAWLDALNAFHADAELYRRFQVWYFRYPTGGDLLESAAALREKLQLARDTFDPEGRDEALERVVLIGHSMGGLVARLQISYASDILWRHVARQPLEAVRAAPEMRQRLERAFFFDPSPLVDRVVFIGTPHHGATMARRVVGRAASSLVSPFGTEEPAYRQLIDANRDVFYEYLWKSPPTSIDLLEPDAPLLTALARMPVRPGVRMHSIIGTGGNPLGEPSDGVVPVSSARLAGAASELRVPVRHTDLHHDDATLDEVKRILREHARQTP